MPAASQRELWEFHRDDKWWDFAGISAMPSLHVAIAVLLALVALRRSRFFTRHDVLCSSHPDWLRHSRLALRC